MLKITIPITPRTKKNSQMIVMVHGRPMILPSKVYKDYEKNCKEYIPTIEKPINSPVNVCCRYYMPTRRKIDLNNLLEASTDLLVHYKVLEDDSMNIVVSHDGSRVFYDKLNPRTEIEIEEVEPYQEW